MADPEQRNGTEPTPADPADAPLDGDGTALQAYLRTSPLALVQVDAAYRVQRWSPRAEALLGWREADLKGAALPEAALIADADRTAFAETLAAWDPRAPEGLRVQLPVQTRSGEERTTVWYGSAWTNADGQVTALTFLVDDVTEQTAEVAALREAKEQAEAMDQLKSAFLASMSHEIRTPLTSIIGFADVLVEELPPQHQEFAELILTAARRLMGTLNSVLDLAKLERHELELHTDDFDLTAAARETLAIFQPQASAKGLALSLEAPPEPVEVSLDPEAVHRILTNLISNALKFTRAGEVRVRIKDEGTHVRLQVRDTGIGISEAFLPSLFDEFRQEPEARGEVGSGLGLSITRRLVLLMGGTIDVESRKGEGSAFTILLPRRIDAAAHAGER